MYIFPLFVCAGLIWSEVKQLWDVGLEEYINDMWNVIDFVTNSLYVATVALRIVSYYQVCNVILTCLGLNAVLSVPVYVRKLARNPGCYIQINCTLFFQQTISVFTFTGRQKLVSNFTEIR